MAWIEVSIAIAPESAEAVGCGLIERGSLGVWEREAGTMTAYFSAETTQEQLQVILEEMKALGATGMQSVATVPDQDWVATWKAGLTPLRVTPRLVIVPSWQTYQPCEGEQVLVLDPGMAFGTGHHETTRMCLELLDERLQRGDGPNVLDLGTGSGILAIAAAKLGARSVIASEIDPEARETAKLNVLSNGVESRVRVVDGSMGWESGPYDVIVANLTAEDVRDLTPNIAAALIPDGEAILSGILSARETVVTKALGLAGLEVVSRRSAGEWTALTVKPACAVGVDFTRLP